MTATSECIECGSALLADAPAGLCPLCLLKLALDTASVGSGRINLPDAPSLAGAKVHYFGDYELLEELGRGGMGVVYKARQVSLNRIVAVKMMRPGLLSSEADVQRFHVEAEAAASLQHPNIVAIHEVGEHEGLCYFSMDFVAGQSLSDIVHNEPLSAKRAAGYVRTIAEAVHHAHEHGLLHRDLKPANVIIDPAGRPRITDFGLAKRIEGDSGLTQTGAVLGTPSYMPPEQAAGRSKNLGATTDVYSLGAILYELLCGRPPFQAESAVDTLLLVLRTEPVAPRLLNPGLPRDLETICLKCLEKDARRRYVSAQDLADDLGRFLANRPIRARRIGAAGRSWRWCRRNPWQAVAVAGLALFALLATFTAVTLRDRLWRSIVDQARSERLAGNRARSLQLLAEAARMKKSDDLKQEAVQSIVTPGFRLRQAISTPRADEIIISPDSKLIAIAGQREVPHERRLPNGDSRGWDYFNTIDVWDIDAGRKLCEIADDESHPHGRALAFSSTEPILAQLRDQYFTKETPTYRGSSIEYQGIQEQSVVFWNPLNGERIGDVECRDQNCRDITGGLIFSPDGRRLVRKGGNSWSWLIDVSERNSVVAEIDGTVLGFLSNDELVVDGGRELWKHNVTTDDECVCVCPKGSSIVSITPNSRIALLKLKGSLLLWDLVAQKQTALLTPAGKGDFFHVISEDGRVVAIVDKSKPDTIRFYDTTGPGVQERTIALASNIKITLLWPKQIALSPDGSFLAAYGGVGKLGYLMVWDTRTGAQVAMLRDNHSPIWSHNGRLLITRGPALAKPQNSRSANFEGIYAEDNSVNVWDVFGAPPVYLLRDRIGSLAFSSNETQLLSNGVSWDVVSTRDRLELRTTAQTAPPESIALSSGDQLWAVQVDDSQTLAATPQSKILARLRMLPPENREIVLDAPDYSGLKTRSGGLLFARPDRFAITPDIRLLIIVSTVSEIHGDNRSYGPVATVLESWDLVNRKRIAILREGKFQGIGNVDMSPDGRLLATVISQEGILITDLSTGKEIRLIDSPDNSYAILKFSPDGKLLFSAKSVTWKGGESPILVYDVASGRQLQKWSGHPGGIVSFAISSDGTMLASGGNDRVISLWDTSTGRKLASWEAHQAEVSALAITRDSGTLVSGGTDGALKLWDLSFIRKELSLLDLGW